jgi:hypothetical protein
VSDPAKCSHVAPQPFPPPSVAVDGHPRWHGWEPLTCQREPGHAGQHEAGQLRWPREGHGG